jgi:hypothetical protein
MLGKRRFGLRSQLAEHLSRPCPARLSVSRSAEHLTPTLMAAERPHRIEHAPWSLLLVIMEQHLRGRAAQGLSIGTAVGCPH